MNNRDRIVQVTEELWSLIQYLTQEYDIPCAEMVGVLEIIKIQVMEDANEQPR